MKLTKTKTLFGVVIILLLMVSGLLFSIKDDKITTNIINNEGHLSLSVTIESLPFKKYYVALDHNKDTSEETKWISYNHNIVFDLEEGSYYLHVKDSKDKIIESTVSCIIALEYKNNLNYPFYPIGKELEVDYHFIGLNSELKITSSDENVVEVIDNKLITKTKGVSLISLGEGDLKQSFEIEVTGLYTTYDENSDSKPYLKETICTEEEAHKLDEVLRLEIEKAGYQTRAGVVAAARFLALQFPYKITYMSESGRLDPDYHLNTDGEGRYYHIGLFLSEDKFEQLGLSKFGRATWGQFFIEDDSDDHSLDDFYLYDGFVPSDIGSHFYLSKRPNGLDCSGYVSWIYLNGGFDFGDLGAGGPDTPGMSQLGERVNITDDLLKSDRIKAGDLIGNAGHIGMVIGVEEDYIWVTDTLITGTKVTRYERNIASFDELGVEAFRYFMLMDDEYKEDGNYTAMWR